MKKQFLSLSMLALFLVATVLVFNSCKKNNTIYNNPTGEQFDNSQMTTATFLGQIIKEDGSPLDGAMVSTGSNQITTDADGFFYFSNISTPLNATMIKVQKQGYFEAYRTIKVIANEDNHTRIMIMELPPAVTFDAATGGQVTIANGGSIGFPANALVDASTNQAYTGSVNVYAKWIDPTSAELPLLMPGALRGITTGGAEQGLTTYGMQAVELRGAAGQELQIANGQKAELRFPVPVSMQGSAPTDVPAWSLNEQNGMWVEESSGTRVGNEYIAEVSHFSFWNIDWPVQTVNFTCTLVDANSNPVGGAWVVLDPQTLTLSNGYASSNSNGVVSGVIPANATYNLDYIPTGCTYNSTSTFLQSVVASTSNINLGTITVTNASNPAVVSGTIQDCNSAVLANTPVKLVVGSSVLFETTNASGQFTFNLNCLTGVTSADITAYDPTNAVNGSMNVSLTPNSNTNIGVLQACGTVSGFINWASTVGATTTNGSIVDGMNGANLFQQYQMITYITGSDSTLSTNQYISFGFDGPQTVAGTHTLMNYYDNFDVSTTQNITGSPTVTLTNYQTVGGWIEGSFTATITSGTIPTRTVVCSFRVQRQM